MVPRGIEFAIRPYQLADIDALHQAVVESLPELKLWMPWAHDGYGRVESETWICGRDAEWRDDHAYEFAIIDVASGVLVGGCGINQLRREIQTANLGYWVRSSWTRQGAASQAARLAARFAIEELGLTRVEIVVATGNLSSQRAAEKAGAVREGVLRNRLILQGRPVDAVVFSFITQDLGVGAISS